MTIKSISEQIESAVKRHQLDRLTALLDAHPAAIQTSDDMGLKPLSRTIHYRWLEGFQFLLNRGADVNARERSGWRPIHFTAIVDNSKMMQLLFEYGCTTVETTIDCGRTALHLAAENGTLEIIEFLLQRGFVNPDIFSDLNETPLYKAAVRGHPAIVQRLLLAGSNWNIRENLTGRTPLHAACYLRSKPVPVEDRIATIHILMQFGANPHLLTDRNFTPMCQLIENVDIPEMIIAIASYDSSCLSYCLQEKSSWCLGKAMSLLDFAQLHRRSKIVRLLRALQISSEDPYFEEELEEDFIDQCRYSIYFELGLTQQLMAALT